jgi:Skp family chaperone for outer membrane proteins
MNTKIVLFLLCLLFALVFTQNQEATIVMKEMNQQAENTLSVKQEQTTLESHLSEYDTELQATEAAAQNFIQTLDVDTPLLGEVPTQEDLTFINQINH